MNKLLIMLVAGILLVIISFWDFGDGDDRPAESTKALLEKGEGELVITGGAYEDKLEERLEAVLSLAEGVGKVETMITIKASGEKIALVEQPYTSRTSTEKDSQGGSRDTSEVSRSETVIYIKNSDGSETPYIAKETTPEIEGVVVIAEGGGNILTVSNIIDAVMALFDVPNHKIKVLEMKTAS
ncbi:MAG: stage III sporulation protein AG [Lachnospiraceae bacterium]|nr:stage III sporulation protein AG [Lachnospiraceae bacterium]